MDRCVKLFQDCDAQKAVDRLNGYCCNTDNQPVQIEVITKPGITMIFAILEKEEYNGN